MAPDGDVAAWVEDFASTLVASGVPRMPARVFACLMASEGGRLGAGELAERLQASPAAVSGAVRYLETVAMLRRTREPGARRDLYVVDHDVWHRAIMSRDALLGRWVAQVEAGIAAVGAGTEPAGRLEETREFLTFLLEEMAALQKRWEERRSTRP